MYQNEIKIKHSFFDLPCMTESNLDSFQIVTVSFFVREPESSYLGRELDCDRNLVIFIKKNKILKIRIIDRDHDLMLI